MVKYTTLPLAALATGAASQSTAALMDATYPGCPSSLTEHQLYTVHSELACFAAAIRDTSARDEHINKAAASRPESSYFSDFPDWAFARSDGGITTTGALMQHNSDQALTVLATSVAGRSSQLTSHSHHGDVAFAEIGIPAVGESDFYDRHQADGRAVGVNGMVPSSR
jgi:hypothetical protein